MPPKNKIKFSVLNFSLFRFFLIHCHQFLTPQLEGVGQGGRKGGKVKRRVGRLLVTRDLRLGGVC
jgi:hypothetical protein